MSKKTSRATRVAQSQRSTRDGEKKKVEAARPLISNSSVLTETEPVLIEPRRASAPVIPAPLAPEESSALPPRARGPLPPRRPVAAVRQPVLSREEEFAFVRADLRTVLFLTVLMLIVLVVLTFLISR